MSWGCSDCFKDIRSISDILKQTRIDAEKFCQKEKCNVAIIATGTGFTFEMFEEGAPSGTIEIITPGKGCNDEAIH